MKENLKNRIKASLFGGAGGGNLNRPMFERIRKSKTVKLIMAFTAINLLAQIAFPSVAMALTAGSASPEFASFEPVATTDMVNDFTGDFTYNLPVLSVPGPDGGGYSMSLSYHSGGGAEDEASWVGHGWTLNPGAINRQKRGFADDFKGVTVQKYSKQYPNWTHTTGFNINLEYNSSDDGNDKKDEQKKDRDKQKEKDKKENGKANKPALKFVGVNGFGGGKEDTNDDNDGDRDSDESLIQPSVSFSKSIRYNNYSGFSITNGFGVGVNGMGSLNMNRSGGENTLGFSINPLAILKRLRKNKIRKARAASIKELGANINGTDEEFNNASNNYIKEADRKDRSRVQTSSYSSWSFNAPAVPYSVAYNSGRAYNFSMSLAFEVFTVGVQLGIQGSMNHQADIPEVPVAAYGYMYNPDKSIYDAIEGKNFGDLKPIIDQNKIDGTKSPIPEADFQIEKGSTFNKHDKNLGIPFNTADIFTATGNGVMGGFKFYHNKVGHYYPTFVNNEQKIVQVGGEVAIGQTIAIGLDLGLGFQHTKVQDWRKLEQDDKHIYDDYSANPYMAFAGDMGGQVDYSGEGLVKATVGGGYMNRKLDLDEFDGGKTDLDTDNDRKTSRVEHFTDATGKLNGIEVTNKDGNVSVYANPVYTKEEYQLTVGIKDTEPTGKYENFQYTNEDYAVPHRTDFDKPINEKTVVGQYVEEQYANTFLLTENRTFDYVDADWDGTDLSDPKRGPSNGDFGGWTKFDYRTAHTNYQYRAPYEGIIYNEGRMMDANDQSGSVSTGQKEVEYLKTIETKTHIAFFVTNNTNKADAFPAYTDLDLDGSYIKSNDDKDLRTDGIDADRDNGGVPSAPHHLEKLERVVLYAKKDLSKPISTTYFNYDYSLCKGIPNTTTMINGKLTLKKVWTESGGTIKSKVAPYQFDYNYHVYADQEILDKYEAINGYDYSTNPATPLGINDGYLFTSLAQTDNAFEEAQMKVQNPMYKEGLLDPWGSYRLNTGERYKFKQPWVDQKDPTTAFDPAAWQLKQIKLPSGGEIHVQYEQKDYRFVQNKAAMGMASLKADAAAVNGYKSGNVDNDVNGTPQNRYYIDLELLGLKPNESETYATAVSNYRNSLDNYFVQRKNKLYFKMLYSYRDKTVANLNSYHQDIDYITGYTAVNKVGMQGLKIYFELGELKKNGDGKKDKTLPRYVGYQKFLTAAHKNLDGGGRNIEQDDEALLAAAYDANGLDETPLRSKAKDLARSNTFNFFGDWTKGNIKNKSIKEVCRNYNPELSYFKIPLYNAKKGGGIRVKRLLSYDPGISGETGDAMIYGSEYIYKNTNGLSSGVATNEPSTIREENALVGILERNKQSGWNKTFKGRDSKQYEGPLGETLLPGAQVVHERVIVKNIHSGRTTTGYAVNNYHTVRTNPMKVDFSELSKSGDDPTYKKYNLSLPLGLINLSYNKAWVTQGYLFKLNDMNGKPESQATYAGNYSPATFREAAFTSKTTYAYSAPGDEVETLVYNTGTNDFELGKLRLGQEEELAMYRSRVRDVTQDFSIELDLNLLLQYTPTVTIGFGLSYSYTQNELSQHVTSKVLRQKSILLATTTTTDGVTQITENIAFDKNTGDPVLTKTYDGYMDANEQIHTKENNAEPRNTTLHNGHYYALNIPASWVYTEMGQKDASNSNSNQLTASVGNVVTYGEDIRSKFSGGIWSPINAPLTKVVNASATVYKKDWFSGTGLPKESELDRHYYPQRTYVYRKQVTNANDATKGKIYDGGLIIGDFNLFPWLTPSTSTPIDYTSDLEATVPNDQSEVGGSWYSASEIKKYSPNGYPLEEQDVLGIYSAAKFGYESTLPVLVAQNAREEQVHFIDFEGTNKQGFSTTNASAHSGSGAFDLQSNPGQVFFNQYNLQAPLMARGVTIKLWLKSSLSSNPGSTEYGMRNPSPNLQAIIGSQTFNFKRVAQTGEWSLYTVDIKNFKGLANRSYNISLDYAFAGNEEVLIDDVRIQPLDAVMNCTVYNKDNKVSAQFDDQHFGVYYEYNNKEQLVRKSIETERGKKPLQEQQYNTPLINRN